MSDDNKNAFGEKTIVASSKDVVTPEPSNADKTVVYAQSNLQETFDARTVVRSSKPAPSALPAEAPPKVIAVDLPPAVAASIAASVPADADMSADDRASNAAASAEKPKLSKDERREARAALDRKTRSYKMALAVTCVFAVACGVVVIGSKSSDKPAATTASGAAQAEGPADTNSTSGKTDLASEDEDGTTKNKMQEAKMLGAYKTTTDVLKDFDRASKKAQDHSVGF